MPGAAAEKHDELAGSILCMGNPLLDISAVVDQAFLDKWDLKMNNAILAEEKHVPLYQEMIDNFKVEYVAGGATQNSARVAQWMLQAPGAVTYMGSIGKDEFGKQMKECCATDGVTTQYYEDESAATGTCAVGVLDGERTLCANLSAANNYKVSHLEQPEMWAIAEKAKLYYMAGFFITVCPDAIIKVAEHACANNKIFCMNLSAPFIMQVPPFKATLMAALPYMDFLFGNETEAQTFAETEGWETRDVAEIAKKISEMPKTNDKRSRTVVFTQGADATVVAREGKVTLFPVIKLEKKDLVDTNGAGDAFVGGFLSKLVLGADDAECCRAGNYSANCIIQQNGCTFPKVPTFDF
eukprot:1192221-Prorocentrum_minimum.AAC.3